MKVKNRPVDTSEEAERVQINCYRAMSAERKFEIASELNELCRELQLTGIKQRHPEYTDGEVTIAHARLVLGEKLFALVHPKSMHICP